MRKYCLDARRGPLRYSLATEGPFSKERCDACVNLASVMLDSGGDAEEAARLYKSALESADL